ncbi:MAG: hypothetical protein LBB08_00860 [Rickettsiales bacterium]|nr:hypothetical protein [Rickettsiales bacterium]
MKKIFALISALFVLPVFAEVMPVYDEIYDEEPPAEEYAPPESDEVPPSAAQVQAAQAAPVGSSINRAASAARRRSLSSGQPARQAGASSSRAVGARSAVQVAVAPRATARSGTSAAGSRPVSSRSAAAQSRGAATRSSRTIANAIVGQAPAVSGNPRSVGRVGANNQKVVQARAGIQTALYNGGVARAAAPAMRASVGAAARSPIVMRASSTPQIFSTESAAEAPSIESAEEAAANLAFCKAQYLECMDNFCNVLDDNQGRCTCSSTVKKYESVESALKLATDQLQDVATKIKYLGLSKEDVNSLFKATEAELTLNQTDSTTIKNNLDSIKKMLVDPTGQTTTSGGISTSFDMSALSFGDSFDLSMFTGSSDASVLSQRGQALYDIAKSRCASIITDCKKRGVESGLVTASYELEIDKQCVAYERELSDANDSMKTTVKNATNVLQQARLMLAQNKNKYDLKGCVNALDTCMQDEFVCGQDYKFCLDGKSEIIVDGKIVLGSEPTINNLKSTEDLSTLTLTSGKWALPSLSNKIFQLLLRKMGTIDSDGKVDGMCGGIMKQCQNYSYGNGSFLAVPSTNIVLQEYLIRTREKISAKQLEVIDEYKVGCINEMRTCFAKQTVNTVGSDNTSWVDQTVTLSACNSYVKTCAAVLELGYTKCFDSAVSADVCSKDKRLHMISSSGGGACMVKDTTNCP